MNMTTEELIRIVASGEFAADIANLASEEIRRRITAPSVKTEERDEKSEGGKLFTEQDMKSAFGKGFHVAKKDRANSVTWEDHFYAFKGYYPGFWTKEEKP